MSTPAARLLELIRSEAKSGLWSSGVNLARGGAVAQESRTGSEVVLRVKAAGRPVPWTAILYPGDEAWECNCPGRVDPCEHVVAAAIVLQQAEQQGGEVEGRDALAKDRMRDPRAHVTFEFQEGVFGILGHRAGFAAHDDVGGGLKAQGRRGDGLAFPVADDFGGAGLVDARDDGRRGAEVDAEEVSHP